MQPETIAIASDHAGFPLKSLLMEELEALGFAVLDLGTDGTTAVDYPDFAHTLAGSIKAGQVAKGVLICGTGIGISIAANRHPEVRAALVHDAFDARTARQHNDANVICFGGRTTGSEVARDCLRIFLSTDFEGGRHIRRVDKLNQAE